MTINLVIFSKQATKDIIVWTKKKIAMLKLVTIEENLIQSCALNQYPMFLFFFRL